MVLQIGNYRITIEKKASSYKGQQVMIKDIDDEIDKIKVELLSKSALYRFWR
ncbi:hypothetical protein [Vulcanibacillus modesticaldus]|uniref:hypothetical protein n=1 Tax=Vulcanibacillus modesticaldus TaxID=337097 RepID=UPI00159F2AF9|nr:hypothetical protein [Vulcanibacillus modesticaldus]